MLPLSAASSATVTAAAATAASAVAASSAVTSAATGATGATVPIRLADAGLYRRPSPADNDSLSHMALIIPVS